MPSINLPIRDETIKISKKEIDAYKKMFKYIVSKNIEKLSNYSLKNILSSINERELFYSYICFSNYHLTFINNNVENENKYFFNLGKGFNINKKIIILGMVFFLI